MKINPENSAFFDQENYYNLTTTTSANNNVNIVTPPLPPLADHRAPAVTNNDIPAHGTTQQQQSEIIQNQHCPQRQRLQSQRGHPETPTTDKNYSTALIELKSSCVEKSSSAGSSVGTSSNTSTQYMTSQILSGLNTNDLFDELKTTKEPEVVENANVVSKISTTTDTPSDAEVAKRNSQKKNENEDQCFFRQNPRVSINNGGNTTSTHQNGAPHHFGELLRPGVHNQLSTSQQWTTTTSIDTTRHRNISGDSSDRYLWVNARNNNYQLNSWNTAVPSWSASLNGSSNYNNSTNLIHHQYGQPLNHSCTSTTHNIASNNSCEGGGHTHSSNYFGVEGPICRDPPQLQGSQFATGPLLNPPLDPAPAPGTLSASSSSSEHRREPSSCIFAHSKNFNANDMAEDEWDCKILFKY